MIPIWKSYVVRPILPSWGGILETDISKILNPVSLIFRVKEADCCGFSPHGPVPMFRYFCESCRCASGSDEVFQTTPASAKKMKDGPTPKQQEQISYHSRQHKIMWAWARGIE